MSLSQPTALLWVTVAVFDRRNNGWDTDEMQLTRDQLDDMLEEAGATKTGDGTWEARGGTVHYSIETDEV